jgi:hypothetical protein
VTEATGPAAPQLCKCGGANPKPMVFVFTSERGMDPVGARWACEACRVRVFAHMDRVSPVFDAMVAAEIDRHIAGATLTYLINQLMGDA